MSFTPLDVPSVYEDGRRAGKAEFPGLLLGQTNILHFGTGNNDGDNLAGHPQRLSHARTSRKREHLDSRRHDIHAYLSGKRCLDALYFRRLIPVSFVMTTSESWLAYRFHHEKKGAVTTCPWSRRLSLSW